MKLTDVVSNMYLLMKIIALILNTMSNSVSPTQSNNGPFDELVSL